MLYVQGAKTYLSDAGEELAKITQESKRETDPMEGVIEAWLETDAEKDRYELQKEQFGGDLELRDKVCVMEIWQDCLEQKGKPRAYDSRQIGQILNKLPLWEKGSTGCFGMRFGIQKIWKKVSPF
jgi:hypothetical protein